MRGLACPASSLQQRVYLDAKERATTEQAHYINKEENYMVLRSMSIQSVQTKVCIYMKHSLPR